MCKIEKSGRGRPGRGWFWKFGHTRTRGGVVYKSEILADVLCRRPLK